MPGTRNFIIPGDVSHLARISAYLNETVCGVLLHMRASEDQRRALRASAERFSHRTFTLDSLMCFPTAVLEAADWPLYEHCLRAILADSRVHYLAMRSYFDSALNTTAVIDRIVVNSLNIILSTRPDRLISSSTPHSVQAWIFARCVEEAGRPVYILERTPINNRAWIYRGLDTQQVVLRKSANPSPDLSTYTRMQVQEQIASKPGARDAHGYYISRMDLSTVKGAESNAWWSYRRELSHVLTGRVQGMPIRLLSSVRKRHLYRSYGRLAIKEVPDTPYVIYFMHYQPERSSLPEGRFHTQQLIAMRQLAWTVPKGWTLLVREHPSMWLLPLDVSVRSAEYFEQVASLPNTRLCSMDVDTFELIDRCSVVATLTGSVGFQAILRGKPVFAFGLPAYKDHPGCVTVDTSMDLAQAFTATQQNAFVDCFQERALRDYLLWVERNSVAADLEENNWLEARLKNFAALYREVLDGSLAI
jgi:Capsule polysaccharide biosynthesis protein